MLKVSRESTQTAQVVCAVIKSKTAVRAEGDAQAVDFCRFAALRQSENNRASAHLVPRWIRFARLMVRTMRDEFWRTKMTIESSNAVPLINTFGSNRCPVDRHYFLASAAVA